MLGDACCRRQIAAAADAAAEETDSPVSGVDDWEKSLMLAFELQVEQLKADFENERQEHQQTKAQVASLTIQWTSLHDQLRRCKAEVRGCWVDVSGGSRI